MKNRWLVAGALITGVVILLITLTLLFVALLLGGEMTGTRAALNLGGIANLTIMSPVAPPFAFDIGPANALKVIIEGCVCVRFIL